MHYNYYTKYNTTKEQLNNINVSGSRYFVNQNDHYHLQKTLPAFLCMVVQVDKIIFYHSFHLED